MRKCRKFSRKSPPIHGNRANTHVSHRNLDTSVQRGTLTLSVTLLVSGEESIPQGITERKFRTHSYCGILEARGSKPAWVTSENQQRKEIGDGEKDKSKVLVHTETGISRTDC